MTERDELEVLGTLAAVAPVARELRERGFDATLWVGKDEDHYAVSIRIRIPPLGTPVEAVA